MENRKSVNGINIEAITHVQLRKKQKDFHTKGRGNGYVAQ